MNKITQMYGLRQNDLDMATRFVAGIECEIESVDMNNGEQHFPNFNTTVDGSLRNDGMEFISIPLDRESLLSSFKHLHATIELHEPSEAFSARTSTHVHINCRTLTPQQTRQLVLFYALFEEFFFIMVENNRRTNIHCVPLTETFLPQVYRGDIMYYSKHWHKYTALNVIPLIKQGSIEFRHLQGTKDDQLLSEWLATLDNLWQLCQRETMTPENLADPVQIKQWWQTLFGHCPRVMSLEPALPNIIQNSLLDVKFAFV